MICFLYYFYLYQPEITMKDAVLQTVDMEDEPWPACEGLHVPLVAPDPGSGFSLGSCWTASCLTRHLRPICLQEGQIAHKPMACRVFTSLESPFNALVEANKECIYHKIKIINLYTVKDIKKS